MVDGKSIIGSVLTVYFFVVGRVTLNEIALYFAILSGALTSSYTAYKWIRDIKKDFKK